MKRPCNRCGVFVDFTANAADHFVFCVECFALELLLRGPAGAVKLVKNEDGEIVLEGLKKR